MASSRARMLRLLSLLQTHRYWSGIELAERLEVSPRTLRRDVDRLRELGYPVDASRGVAGGYQLQAGAALPPLLLDDDEAVAIAVSLRTAGAVVSGLEETSVQALSKLVQVMPPRLRRRVDAVQKFTVPAVFSGPTVDAVALSTLAQACRDDERLEFDYRKRDGDAGPRAVEPHRLVLLGRRWYLVAWDLGRHDWRSFRVDRLSEPRSTGVRFRQRTLPADDAAAFVTAGIDSARTQVEAVVNVFAPADTVRQVSGRWAQVQPLDDYSCRMQMRADTMDWPAMLLGAVGAEFEVVSPPELTDHLRTIGERFTRSTSPT